MTTPEPVCQNPNCGTCIRRAEEEQHRAEAAQGLRCASCLDLFGKYGGTYPAPTVEDPSLCSSCARVAKAPKFPGRGYEHVEPKQRGTT
jgi:hypothetical protein